MASLEKRLSLAARDKVPAELEAAVAAADALGLSAAESAPYHSANMALIRVQGAGAAMAALDKALASGSLPELQKALEAASRAGVDFETCEAAGRAAELVAQQVMVLHVVRAYNRGVYQENAIIFARQHDFFLSSVMTAHTQVLLLFLKAKIEAE